LAVAASLLVAIGWWSISAWEGSPSFALYKLSEAIKSHDADGAAYYVDFKEVTHSIVQQVIAAKSSASAKSGEMDILGEVAANQMMSMFEPTISDKLKEGFKEEVLTESDAGVNSALLHAIVHLQNNGHTAVSELQDEKEAVRFHLTRENDGDWRITSFDVPPKYLAKLTK
jgi:hypothetical protein